MSAAAPSGIAGIDVAAATAAIEQAGGLGAVMSEETSAMTGTADNSQGQQGATEQTGSSGQVRDPVTGRWVSPGQEVTQQTPPGQAEPAQTTPDAFTAVDPTSLAPELQSIYKNMQADYTRKTQEIAEQRRLIEQLGGSEQITEAARLYQSLQNPAYWPQLYAELKDGMEQLGLSPEEAHVAATQEVQRQQTAPQSTQFGGNEGVDWNDPDLAPLKAMFDSLDQKITGMQSTFEQQREAEKQERLQQAIIGEMQRQENMIRQMNPNYTDDDLNSIYELSTSHQGNLLEAQQRYEAIVQSRLERFLAQKQTAVGNSGIGPVSGGAVQTSQPVKYGSLDEAHVAALESLRQMEALDN